MRIMELCPICNVSIKDHSSTLAIERCKRLATPHNWILTVCNSRGLVAWDMHLGAITAKQAEKIRRDYECIGTAGLIYKVERTTIPMQPFGGWTSKITATML